VADKISPDQTTIPWPVVQGIRGSMNFQHSAASLDIVLQRRLLLALVSTSPVVERKTIALYLSKIGVCKLRCVLRCIDRKIIVAASVWMV